MWSNANSGRVLSLSKENEERAIIRKGESFELFCGNPQTTGCPASGMLEKSISDNPTCLLSFYYSLRIFASITSMCGIFGVTYDPQNAAAETVLEGLKKLEYRGYDSWGIALAGSHTDPIRIEKHIGKIGGAQTTLPAGRTAVGHTRWATHGGVTDINAHPHNDCNGTVSVIHNGIVENFQELKTELVQKGHVFVSETDTEVIAHLVEEYRKKLPLDRAVLTTFKSLHGSNAIAVLDQQSGSIVVCRNGSPLVIGYGENCAYLASDVTALLKKTRRVHFLLDGEAATLNRAVVRIFDIASEAEKNVSPEIIDWKAEQAEKDGYAHFMLKEIHEQEKTIPAAFESNNTHFDTLSRQIRLGMMPVFVGCGSAYYCGLAATYMFAQAGVESRVYGAYELEPFIGTIGINSLVFAISQSGETADTLIAVKRAKKSGATIVALVNARGSTLERFADVVLHVSAGPEISVVSTKAFTAQLAILAALTQRLRGKVDARFPSEFIRWIGSKKLSNSILSIAKQLVAEEHMYVVGKHINYASAFEFALKMKETSYIHAEAFSSGELKHGVISLIQKGTPCIVLTAKDTVFPEVISSAIELKSRGGLIVGVGPVQNKAFDFWIQTPDSGVEYSPFYNVIVGQLLGYFLSVGRGADPDKPRNLAKSVTVK